MALVAFGDFGLDPGLNFALDPADSTVGDGNGSRKQALRHQLIERRDAEPSPRKD